MIGSRRPSDRPALSVGLGGFLLGWTVLGGCVGSSAPARFYTLTPIAGAAATTLPGSGGETALRLGPVELPAYLDRSQIVTRRGADELELAEFDRWAEPLRDTVTRVLAENLGSLLQTERIMIVPRRGSAPGHQVIVDVLRFEGVLGGDVVLDARWRVVTPEGRDAVVRRSAIREAVGVGGYPALVAAMSRALGGLSRDLATALRGL